MATISRRPTETATTEKDSRALEPVVVQDGLAIYSSGWGKPVLLMPYPHASTQMPMADGSLAHLLEGLGRRVITFDPPGIFRSTRPARIDMSEMLDCAEQALDVCGANNVVDIVGHSMGALCSLVLAMERPHRENASCSSARPRAGFGPQCASEAFPLCGVPGTGDSGK